MNDNYSAGSKNIEIPADEFKVHKSIYHGAIIRTGATCKKIPSYMRNSHCRWLIVKNVNISKSC